MNLSGRNLFDSHLVQDIGSAIEDAGLPPSALTLELTESTVMAESNRSMAVLDGLRDLGHEGSEACRRLLRAPLGEEARGGLDGGFGRARVGRRHGSRGSPQATLRARGAYARGVSTV